MFIDDSNLKILNIVIIDGEVFNYLPGLNGENYVLYKTNNNLILFDIFNKKYNKIIRTTILVDFFDKFDIIFFNFLNKPIQNNTSTRTIIKALYRTKTLLCHIENEKNFKKIYYSAYYSNIIEVSNYTQTIHNINSDKKIDDFFILNNLYKLINESFKVNKSENTFCDFGEYKFSNGHHFIKKILSLTDYNLHHYNLKLNDFTKDNYIQWMSEYKDRIKYYRTKTIFDLIKYKYYFALNLIKSEGTADFKFILKHLIGIPIVEVGIYNNLYIPKPIRGYTFRYEIREPTKHTGRLVEKVNRYNNNLKFYNLHREKLINFFIDTIKKPADNKIKSLLNIEKQISNLSKSNKNIYFDKDIKYADFKDLYLKSYEI